MLVLSRKADQAFVFPELGIRVVVVDIRSGAVKLGIEADKRHTILREELIAADTDTDTDTAPPPQGSTVHVDVTAASASRVG